MMEVFFVHHVLMMCIPILGRPEEPEDYIEKGFREMTTHGYVALQTINPSYDHPLLYSSPGLVGHTGLPPRSYEVL